MSRDAHSTALGVGGVAILVAIGIVALIVYGVKDQARWEDWCRSQGGRVVKNSKTVSTVGSNGKPGIGTETTYFCLTTDGRVLDIR